MNSVKDLHKSVTFVRPSYEVQLGISPKNYILEVISTRSLKHKMIHDVKPEMILDNAAYRISAPAGYRISRAWQESVTVANEVRLDF